MGLREKNTAQRVDEMARKEVFFFKQKTAYEMSRCDWSSDVCSSDLPLGVFNPGKG
jgi:hypothetical protein